MHVEPEDWRPPSLVSRAALSGAEWLGGLGTVGGVALISAISSVIFAVATVAAGPDSDAPLIDEEVVSARFVQLGRDFQQELPNRNVPVKSTAPDDRTAISKRPRDFERPDAGPRPPDPMEDPMQRLLNRADLFAETTPEYEREGSPDGIEEGTETEARAGDVYAGQLYVFFRRGWTVPTTISDEEQQDLAVTIAIEVGEDLEITTFRVGTTSGNADFDQSVIAQIERLKANDLTIPEPPILVRPQYVGTSFRLRFRGRHAARE